MPCYFGDKKNSFKSDGIVSKYVTSLASGDGDRYVKGKSNEEELTLNIINFPSVHAWMIEDLFSSPYVYIHNNEDLLSDELTDWLYAEITDNSINVRRTGNVINSRFTVKMPKKYTITT